MKPLFDIEPMIQTNGASLQPARIIDDTGEEIWIWYVSEFTDDSFLNGKVYNPKEFANSKNELLKEID